MAYYDAFITFWGTKTGTTQQKLDAVNTSTVTGTVPTTLFTTGDKIANCVNFNEFNALTAAFQTNVLRLCGIPGQLLGGSANTAFLTDGMIVAYFPNNVAITSGTYNSGTGVVTLTVPTQVWGVGAKITIHNLTGTGAFASLNGTPTTISPTATTTVTYNAGAGLGSSTITGGSITPPTITALTALAQATVQPWWQANGYPRAFDMGDVAAAGVS